eukprot:CAMPEP_0119012918 /NCGR_PEP_ID=MMETSP1176-20130426/7696_1 /TAXON_ID=265551 /ORGANISM="Synedropsis recta cf, Strain CCMP1620" /LENGTH=209 /DNA_ID=CAMNT_0006965957 /DNA_START=174 /DNA_END=803 /DNA_ORIENTATION=+
MTIVREEGDILILINTVRLSEDGLEELDKLGKVKHTIRVGGYHGVDDAFYKEKYGATTWSVEKNYFGGFDKDAEPYMVADNIVTKDTKLPIKDASMYIIESADPKEGLLLLKRTELGVGTVAISGDCLQNFTKSDEHFNMFGRIMMWFSGFLMAHNVGPAWYTSAKAKKEDVKAILDLDFDHVIPCHGEPCHGEATKKYEKSVNALKEQ